MNKRGQLTLGDAPQVVMVVGLTFLVMATIAFVANSYGASFPADESGSAVNESLTITSAGTKVAGASACNFEDFAVSLLLNSTNTIVNTGNYTTTSGGEIANITALGPLGTGMKATYSYSYTGTACNVTSDLQTNISENTSIAGIVLTISLVGIVLTVLIGIFLIAKNRGM